MQKKKKRIKTLWAHYLPVCVDDVNLLGENVNIIRKNTEAVLDPNNEVGLK
jgi:hypothetical protein